MDQIAADAAKGQGESLEVLAALIGVQADDQATFNLAVQQNFDQIFSSEAVTSAQALENLATVLSSDAELKKYLG